MQDVLDDFHDLAVEACGIHAMPATLWEAPGAAGQFARCRRCFDTLPPGVAATTICQACRRHPPSFAASLAPFDYRTSGIADWILRFKHGGRRDLARPLGRFVVRALLSPGARRAGVDPPSAGDFFVPVPLHPVRLAERGYDQAGLLATELARLCGGHALPLLKRTRATHTQGDLGAPPRRRNVQGAFSLTCRLPRAALDPARANFRLWLVDDVMTSGATASACAAALRSAGARQVHVLAIARA